MSETTPWDHLFAVFVFVVYPLYTRRTFPEFVRRIRAGGEAVKVSGYRWNIVTWLGFAAVLVALWVAEGRSWAALGLGPASPLRLTFGLGLGLAVVAATALHWRRLGGSGAAELDRLVDGMGDLASFMPRSRREESWFRAVSVTAGVTEELVYRGFLLWYLEPFVGLALAALLSVVAFAGAHAYQGAKQLPGIAIAAALLVGLYLVSGSLVPLIVVHAVVDILQGNGLARHLRRREDSVAADARS